MRISAVVLILAIALSCLADPGWEIVIYTNSTVAYSRITIDEIIASEGDLLGAFIEGECRGIGNVFVSEGESYATMNIQGDVPEIVNFQVWDESIDTICTVEFSTLTDPGYDIGYPPDFLPIDAYSGNPINHYPQMELPSSFVIPEDIPTTYDFAEYCWDEDNDPLTVSGIDSEHISISSNGLIVTISSAENWIGIEYVTFWLSDGSLSVHDSVEVFVTAVNDPPQITGTFPDQGFVEIEQYENFSFAVFAEDIDSAISYAWYIDDELQSCSDYIMDHTFYDLREYGVNCVVSDQQYEVEAIWQVTVIAQSSEDNSISAYLNISPNPCRDIIRIQWLPSRYGNDNISLYDIRGRHLLDFKTSNSGLINSSKINHLPTGIYFVRLNSTGKSITRKITIK